MLSIFCMIFEELFRILGQNLPQKRPHHKNMFLIILILMRRRLWRIIKDDDAAILFGYNFACLVIGPLLFKIREILLARFDFR